MFGFVTRNKIEKDYNLSWAIVGDLMGKGARWTWEFCARISKEEKKM